MTERIYLSTTIPYVNARPHLGHALELVQADVLARHHRQRGDQVRFQTGTDDNSLKNVLAAQAEGVPVREFVNRNAGAFAALRGPLALSYRRLHPDQHRPAAPRRGAAPVAGLRGPRRPVHRGRTRACTAWAASSSYREAELTGGRCPEHGSVPETGIGARTGSSGCPATPASCTT